MTPAAPEPAWIAVGRRLQELAGAQEGSPVFDPLAFEEAAAVLAPLLPAPPEAVDAVARLIGIPARLADDWLRETVALLEEGDQDAAAVRDQGTRRIAVLALAWAPDRA